MDQSNLAPLKARSILERPPCALLVLYTCKHTLQGRRNLVERTQPSTWLASTETWKVSTHHFEDHELRE